MEIKKCPFCGGGVKFVWANNFAYSGLPMIVCNGCGMLLSNKYNKRDTKKFMVEAWNRRVDDGREEKYGVDLGE